LHEAKIAFCMRGLEIDQLAHLFTMAANNSTNVTRIFDDIDAAVRWLQA